MNIIYYSSDFFAEMLGISMLSLCKNNQSAKTINIYVVEDKISDTNKKRLQEIADQYKRNLIFIRMPSQEETFPGVGMNLGRTYARMILGAILPAEAERVLSCDSDTLFMDNIEDMYNTELGGCGIAGVYDCVGEAVQKKLLHSDNSMKYCNAGVYLVDLNMWRKENITSKLLDKALEFGGRGLYFLEQDLINIVFKGKIKLLHPRYNILTSIYYFDYEEVLKMKRPVTYYERILIDEAKARPAILHATTCFYIKKRMWVENSDHPYAGFYQDFRRESPWKDEPRIKDRRKKRKKIYAQFWHCMPRRMAVHLAALTINYIRPIYARLTSKFAISTIATQSST